MKKHKKINYSKKKDSQLGLAKTIKNFTEGNIRAGEKMVRGYK